MRPERPDARPRRGQRPPPRRPDPAARGLRLRRRRLGRQRRRARAALWPTRTWTAPSSTCGCRRRSPTRGCAPRSPSASARPGFPVLVLSQYVEQLYARELLASGEGAVGYLLKDRVSDVRQFVDGVRRVLDGGTVLDPEVVATVMARQRDEPLDRLTAARAGGPGADGRGTLQRRRSPPRSSSPRRPWPSTSTASSPSWTCPSTSRSTGGCRRCWRTSVCDAAARDVRRCGRPRGRRRPARARAGSR